jgi:hypothetical protein
MAKHFTLLGEASYDSPEDIRWAEEPFVIQCTISDACRRSCKKCGMGHVIDMMMDAKVKMEEVQG